MAKCEQYKSIAEREREGVELMVKEAKELLSSLPESPIMCTEPTENVNLLPLPHNNSFCKNCM